MAAAKPAAKGTKDTCLACAYATQSTSNATIGLHVILGDAANLVTDAVAIGIGIGLMMAGLSSVDRAKMLRAMCPSHRNDVSVASKPIRPALRPSKVRKPTS